MPDGYAPRDRIVERPGVTALAAASSLLALFVLLPYLQYVLFGVVLAYIIYPVQQRLEPYLGPTPAALVLVLTTLFVVLLPVVYVITVAVQQAFGVVSAIQEDGLDITAIEELVATYGYDVDLEAMYAANQDRIAAGLEQALASAVDLLGTLPGLFIGVTVVLFVHFALLRDGGRLMAWFSWVLPIPEADVDDLVAGLDDLMWASVVGNVAVAAIQAVLLGVGFLLAGVPAVVFLTVATFLLTLLPLVGGFMVWVPASLYLAANGQTGAAASLSLYGLIVMFSDTYLRGLLIGGTDAFNGATVIVGIFGGIVAFGAVGLFIGPVVLGGAKLVLDVYARGREGSVEGPATTASTDDGAGGAEATADPG